MGLDQRAIGEGKIKVWQRTAEVIGRPVECNGSFGVALAKGKGWLTDPI
jgi:hypothetical protein